MQTMGWLHQWVSILWRKVWYRVFWWVVMLTAANAALWNGVLVPCRLLLLSYAVETADMVAVLSVVVI